MEICIFMKFKNMFDKILNEETERFLTNFFGFNFSIFSNEGNTPHFHFFNGDKPNSSDVSGCYHILENDYFDHGKYKGRLPYKTRKNMIEALSNDINYKYIVSEWNHSGNSYVIDGNILNPFSGRCIEISKDEFVSPPKGFI